MSIDRIGDEEISILSLWNPTSQIALFLVRSLGESMILGEITYLRFSIIRLIMSVKNAIYVFICLILNIECFSVFQFMPTMKNNYVRT